MCCAAATPTGATYYLLHVKPSKFDRARVIPIGDGLGRVIAEIIRHVKAFYGTARVPDCDHWDCQREAPLPAGALPVAGRGHPSPLAMSQHPHPAGSPLRAGRTARASTARRWCCARTTAGARSPPST